MTDDAPNPLAEELIAMLDSIYGVQPEVTLIPRPSFIELILWGLAGFILMIGLHLTLH